MGLRWAVISFCGPRAAYGLIVLPGEMHLCAHFLHAVWRLYWKKYLHWFAVRMEMEATIKEEWPVKQWNPHDDFMFIIFW